MPAGRADPSQPAAGTMPAIVGLTPAAAKELVEQAGLVADFEVGDDAPTAAQAHFVYLAKTESGGRTVLISVYGRGGK